MYIHESVHHDLAIPKGSVKSNSTSLDVVVSAIVSPVSLFFSVKSSPTRATGSVVSRETISLLASTFLETVTLPSGVILLTVIPFEAAVASSISFKSLAIARLFRVMGIENTPPKAIPATVAIPIFVAVSCIVLKGSNGCLKSS